MKAIRSLQQQRVDPDLGSSDDELKSSVPKKHKVWHGDETATESTAVDTEQVREDAAAAILKQHEKFMEAQVKLASQYLEAKQELPTVSSKLSVEEDTSSSLVKPGMEGKGQRIVPNVVKNYRKRLKKKRAKEKTHSTFPGMKCNTSTHILEK